METKTLDKQTSDKVSFIAYIIPAFAVTYRMNIREAYLFLKKYGGLDYLMEHWWPLHTDNYIWAVHDIYQICHMNGGPR